MKRYEFNIHKGLIEKFFPKKRIKTKAQIIEVLMGSIQLILQNNKVSKEKIAGKIILIVDKMSRLFFISENKYYSIAFPFFASLLQINPKLSLLIKCFIIFSLLLSIKLVSK